MRFFVLKRITFERIYFNKWAIHVISSFEVKGYLQKFKTPFYIIVLGNTFIRPLIVRELGGGQLWQSEGHMQTYIALCLKFPNLLACCPKFTCRCLFSGPERKNSEFFLTSIVITKSVIYQKRYKWLHSLEHRKS